MDLDEDKIDDAVLALLQLTLHNECRAWKSFDWDVLDRLYQKGMIMDPVGKTKSVILTEEGLARSRERLHELFAKSSKQHCDRRTLTLTTWYWPSIDGRERGSS